MWKRLNSHHAFQEVCNQNFTEKPTGSGKHRERISGRESGDVVQDIRIQTMQAKRGRRGTVKGISATIIVSSGGNSLSD